MKIVLGRGKELFKRILSATIMLILLTNMLIFAVRIRPVEADETLIFQDDFENYNVGDFPSTGGWELVFNGRGDRYQIVTDAISFSGSKSFQLWGYPNWAAVVQKKFDATSSVIGYEFAILIEAVGSGGPGRDEHPGFFNREAHVWGKYYATVMFNHDDMKIYTQDRTLLGGWNPGEWYHIKVILNKSINKYDVWINGELRGEKLSTTNQDTELINALALLSGHPGVKVYYDDVKIIAQGNIHNDIASLPAKAVAPDGSLIYRALLTSASPRQTIVASQGQTVSLTVGYQIWQGSNPSEINQMFFLYSWSPIWPPPSGYYAEIYNGIPPSYPGTTGTRQVDITVPTIEGTYYLWAGWGAHYSVPQAVQAFTQQPSPPAHVKIVVQKTLEYSLSVSFAEAFVNGKTLTSPDSTVYLNPGESIQGYLKVYINNNRAGPWITPVIGTVSWGRQISGSAKGWFTAISNDVPTGTSLQTFSFNLIAPSPPGTYYIGVFTGWMYTVDEVASGDHPANYGDGDDVWDIRQSDWEAIISYGQAPEGAVYRMPGRAIRIVVQRVDDTAPPSVRVLAPNGGESLTVGSTFRIRWEATDNVGVSHVHIWLFQGTSQIGVITSNHPNTGFYDWTVPDRPGTNYKVRIAAVDAAGNAGYDDSDAAFNITSAGFPYFEVEVSPISQTVNQGGTATYAVIVKSFNGFNRQISFTGYTQSGISLTFNPKTVTPPANGIAQSLLTVATSSSLPAGKYGISIECKDVGGQVRWATVELNVVEVRRIASTILTANMLPFNRIFPITLRIRNLDSATLSLRVALEERTGFQAGVAYGDGDEVKDLTLKPGEQVELSFKARVYGVPRVSEVARFKLYVGGKLAEQKDQTLNLNSEFVKVSTFTCPAAVKMGGSFTVGVPVFYSFSMDTLVTLTLTSKESGKNLVITDVLNGDGMKIYSFRVDSSFVNLNSEGIRNFEVKVEAKYPEENYKTAYNEKFAFKVRVSNNVGTSSIIPDSGFIITLNYNGKRYFALYAYNATEAPPPQSERIEDILKWAYSHRNWLVFEAVDGNLKPVMDDGLYKTLAFASDIAYLRATMWSEYNLLSRSDWFKDLSRLAVAAETANFVAKLTGKLAGIIGLKAANMWASSVSSGIDVSEKACDLAMTVTRTVENLDKIKFYEKVLEATNKFGASEDALVWTSIFMLNGGSADLEDANKLLTTVMLPAYPPFVINVNVYEALTFYRLIQSGETKGLSGMRFLSTHYDKDQIDVMGVKVNIGAFKNALIECLGVVGDVYEFYENLKGKFNIPEVFEFAQHLVTIWDEYEMRREICQSASLKFRDAYIKETSNSIAITLTEPETQHKLHLSVFDVEGRLMGFNRTSGKIEANIRNSYYIDLGNTIRISVPLDIKIERIIVDASKAELLTENYTLTAFVYKDGNQVGFAAKSGQIGQNAQKEYDLQLTEDLKPTLNETPSPIPLQYIGVAVAIGFLLGVIAVTLISKWKKKPQ